jgi:hypothetical protein
LAPEFVLGVDFGSFKGFLGVLEGVFGCSKMLKNHLKWNLVHLQSKLFSRQNFLLYFRKDNFGGKKITWQKRLFL